MQKKVLFIRPMFGHCLALSLHNLCIMSPHNLLCSCQCSCWDWTDVTLAIIHKGSDWAWALFWALKKTLKRVKPLKKGLSRVNLLFWALKKVLKRADLLKIVLNWEVLLKRGLNWVGHSKKGSREERSNSKEGSGLNWVTQKWEAHPVERFNFLIYCPRPSPKY